MKEPIRTRLFARFRKPDAMSEQWLREQDRQRSLIEFQGPSIKWPINKLADQAGWFNRLRLRRSA